MGASESDRVAQYRLDVRRVFRSMSDVALAFQNARISWADCVDRQEIDAEYARRGRDAMQSRADELNGDAS